MVLGEPDEAKLKISTVWHFRIALWQLLAAMQETGKSQARAGVGTIQLRALWAPMALQGQTAGALSA